MWNFPSDIVKSGKDYLDHSAIKKAVENTEYEIPFGYVFGDCNIEERGKIIYFPIYMSSFLRNEVSFPVLKLPL